MNHFRYAVLVIGAIGIGVVGFLLGLAFPQRHYVKLNDAMLFNTATGKVCMPAALKYTKMDQKLARWVIHQDIENMLKLKESLEELNKLYAKFGIHQNALALDPPVEPPDFIPEPSPKASDLIVIDGHYFEDKAPTLPACGKE